MAVVYRALQNGVKMKAEQLEICSAELKKLHRIKVLLHFQPDEVLEDRKTSHSEPRWCVESPPLLRGSVMQKKHILASSGLIRTYCRIQLF